MGSAPPRAMLRVTNSASPREERIEVRSERFNSRNYVRWCAPGATFKIVSLIFALLVARTFATAGEILPRDPDYDYEPPAPGSYSLPVVKVAPDDRKSTRLNSSHEWISYAVFCLKKK